MILKNKLPRPWGDDWQLPDGAAAEKIEVPRGAEVRIVACGDQWVVDQMGTEVRCMPSAEAIALRLDEEARVEFYRLQGMDTPERCLTDLRVDMQRGSRLLLSTVTLGGGHVRNNIEVRMHGPHCELEAGGLYLMDREQRCDNYIFVEHASPDCRSLELYKGILDDAARARFNGHVLVQDGASKTEAFQTNRNILLTDKAHVETRPFLEIYNDDVKCSHGSTIGQLDEQALFYLMTRGISERTAVTMLSYAFCDEVIRMIALPELRELVGDMVKKRLHGELTPCVECAIQCSSPCNGPDANFNIDPTKL